MIYSHGGKCIAGVTDQYGNDQFFCDCSSAVEVAKEDREKNVTRYVGRFCQHPISESDRCGEDDFDENLVCLNGGKCRTEGDDIDIWPCNCTDMYTGPYCEYNATLVPECKLNCGSNGACRLGLKELDEINKYLSMTEHLNYTYCHCKEGFTGDECEYESTPCGDEGLLCLNGSECMDGEHCDCSTIGSEQVMYAGRHCQYASTDICYYSTGLGQALNGHPHFCTNNGTCPELGHDQCACPDGFDGARCEFTDNEMQEPHAQCGLSCVNGGKCRKGSKQFEDEVSSLAVAFNYSNGDFEHCACPDGFLGLTYQLSYNVCGGDDKLFCLHGSLCVPDDNVENGYTCDCSNIDGNLAGKYCEYNATDNCEDPTPGVAPVGTFETNLGFCVNGGDCRETAEGTTYCECDSEVFGGRHCEQIVASEPEEHVTPTLSPSTFAPTTSWWPTITPEPSFFPLPTEETRDPDRNIDGGKQLNKSEASDSGSLSGAAKFGIFVAAFGGFVVLFAVFRRRRAMALNDSVSLHLTRPRGQMPRMSDDDLNDIDLL